MYVFTLTLHVIISVILILLILMQPGKGGDVSSAFGGGASTQLFGASGPGNFLTRGTGILAGLFMITSIGLSLYSTQSAQSGTDVDESLQKAGEQEEGAGFGVTAPGATPAPAPAPALTPAPAPTTPDPAPGQ